MKKTLSLLLCFAMIFSLSSIAFAAEDIAVMKAYASGANEDMQAYKQNIETLAFTVAAAGTNAVNGGIAWDISDKGDSSVKAWLEDADSNGLYEAYITANGANIYANPNSSYLFEGYSSLKKIDGMNFFRTDNVLYMESMFADCKALSILDLQYFETAGVTTMEGMFKNCESLVTFIRLDELDTSSVIDMSDMFSGCKSLVNLDLSTFDTSKVIDMSYMFYNCKNLAGCTFGYEDTTQGTDYAENEKVSEFVTYNVTDMSYMFSGCSALTELNLSGFVTANVRSITKIFNGCSRLENLDLSNWNFRYLGGENMAIYQIFTGCAKLKNLYLYNIQGQNAEFHDFQSNFDKVSNVKIYTEDMSFENTNLWKNVLKYMEGTSISYKNLPKERAVLTFTVPAGISYYCISEIGSDENDYVFSDETRSYPKNTKLKISLYGNYTDYIFYVDGSPRLISEDEAIYIMVVDDAAVYAIGNGESEDNVEDEDKGTEGIGATNFLGVFYIIYVKIIKFFKKLFGIEG